MTIEERDAMIADSIKRRSNRGNSSNKKWTEEELNLRHEAIFQEMGKGKSQMQIAFELSQRWGCNQGTVERYIAEAKKSLQEKAVENIEEYRSKMIEKLERLAADAEAHNDRKSMIAAYEQISKLKGAYTTKVEADINGELRFRFGDE
jgi:hypothetical protein